MHARVHVVNFSLFLSFAFFFLFPLSPACMNAGVVYCILQVFPRAKIQIFVRRALGAGALHVFIVVLHKASPYYKS